MKIRRNLLTNFSLYLAAIGVAASIGGLATQLNFSTELLYKYGYAIAGAVVAVGYAYATAGIYRMIKDKNMKRVFISYDHEDKEFALRLAGDLMEMGVRPVIDRLELKVGDDIRQGIDRLIESCPYVIVIASQNSKESEWINEETLQALKREKTILPVVLDVDTIPNELKGIYYADFSKDYDSGLFEIRKVFKPGT